MTRLERQRWTWGVWAVALHIAGCAPASGGLPANAATAGTEGTGAESTGPNAEAGIGSGSEPGNTNQAPGEPGSGPGASEPTTPTGRSLPRVSVRNVGLHIGGGPNDEQTKAPFKSAIERRFEDLLRCYRFVEQPGKTGTFGVDLFIAREGGKPQVRQPRTALVGDAFRSCVVQAFEQVQFTKPKLGPTVISYSIAYELD